MNKDRSSASSSELSRAQQETIEDLLYRLLCPIRLWREENAKPSKGKRWKKLQSRKAAATTTEAERESSTSSGPVPATTPTPEVLKHLTIGFNSTMRSLESLGRESLHSKAPTEELSESLKREEPIDIDSSKAPSTKEENATKQACPRLSVIFICRSTVPVSLVEPLSLAVKRISGLERDKGNNKIRLIYLSRNAETRMAGAVSLPRIGVVGVEECTSARVLIDYVQDNVQEPVYTDC
ncbi:hypothetical protein FQN49_006860 [Arthroderma sp. PD_2]|nr:hypothetical protein FQN49_006860 [Arthroderma sp. PD_2]